MVERICQYCGKDFETRLTYTKRGGGKYCSAACSIAGNATKFRKGHVMSDEVKSKIALGLMGRPCSNETREKMRAARTGILHTAETKQKLSESHKGQTAWNKGKRASLELRRKLSEVHTGLQSRENHPLWKGGISFEPYCPMFNRTFKKTVVNSFGHACFVCGDSATRLCVHHIDYNKNSVCNGNKWAFVPLCESHHAKSNYNRWYWFNLLINYWAMRPEINFVLGDNHYGIYQVSRSMGCK
jgi:hypothetical protein